MSKRGVIAFIIAVLVSLSLIPRSIRLAFGQAASMQAPHFGEGGLPQFEKDPNFPKVPSKWRMGFGSDVAVDAQDHIWILSRPHTLAHPRSTPPDLVSVPAPPVMEFDTDGNFIQAWGGESGPGYQWPSNEHGIHIDYKGFVWILGNADGKSNNPANLPNDNQILKFTKEGKFVMAIGKSGQTGSNATQVLKGATRLHVYPKTNELFVSDGYGNSRIMVYDADTGQFKRMWGAYGNKPLDIDARPPRSEPARIPWVAVFEVLQQFGSPVHDVNISNDGLVYVADRGNKRVQVFTPNGKFIAEQFVGLDSKYPLQARSVAFSPDAAQRFLYVGGSPDIYILNRKTLEVLGSFNIGSPQGDPPGHLITVDHKGNVYAVQAELSGADGHSGGAGAYKFTFKGYSPKVSCPPCASTKRVE
jgi:DNA-binding beta-propeller fold protein YncE